MSQNETLDVIMRMHDSARLSELSRAVFSLVGQDYRPLNMLLCTQRFTRGMLLDVRETLTPLLALEDAPTLDVLNYEDPLPLDARSALINMGIDSAKGRYAAFLDYDDTMYPGSYSTLIRQLTKTSSAIAFGGVAVKTVEVEDQVFYVRSRERPWKGRTLADQLANNFCPIHSFVFERTKLPTGLRFETDLTRHEDYDFLLRVCASVRSDFSLVDTIVGDYYLKSDGSNSILTESSFTGANRAEWQRANAFLAQRRSSTVVAPSVQLDLGLRKPVPGLTIRGVLDRLGYRQPLAA